MQTIHSHNSRQEGGCSTRGQKPIAHHCNFSLIDPWIHGEVKDFLSLFINAELLCQEKNGGYFDSTNRKERGSKLNASYAFAIARAKENQNNFCSALIFMICLGHLSPLNLSPLTLPLSPANGGEGKSTLTNWEVAAWPR